MNRHKEDNAKRDKSCTIAIFFFSITNMIATDCDHPVDYV